MSVKMIRLRYLTLSVLAVLIVVSIVPFVSSDVIRGESTVPDWVKNTAGWWTDELIDDSSFVSSIQWLVTNDIIILSPTEQGIGGGDIVIPSWIKNTAGWWAEDKIHDVVFVGAIRYLINEGIMVVMEPIEEAKCNFKGKEVVCSLTEKEVVEINDFYMEVNSGNCCVNWAYVNEEYRFEIATLDKKRGNYIDGVTITAKIISKDGELRHNFGQVTTEDGIYKSSITIPSIDWYAENILYVTGTYYGVEKTIEKEFEVFSKQSVGGCSGAVNPFDVSDKDGDMTSITFNSDGSKMFLLGLENDDVYEYKLCKNYHLGSASYITSFSLSGRESTPQGIAFNSDGTKMFISGDSGGDINEFALSTAFDISSAGFTGNGCTGGGSGATGAKPTAMNFNADGTKLLVLDKGSNKVRESVLSTGFVITSGCTYDSDNDSPNLNSLSGVEDAKAQGMAFNDDGTKMFILGAQHDKVYQLSLSAFDVSTAAFVASLDISDHETFPSGLEFSSDGKTMFIVGRDGDEINVYALATAWAISTASHK
jgi:DNA-binding beta-propeller fold protein YncE